jgi:CheY-like chemotaxis protein
VHNVLPNYIPLPIPQEKTINALNKKILLIDDEANKGWELVLRKVFETSSPEDFVIIKEKVKDYNSLSTESKNLIENTSFDLYLIDLRLNGMEEENILKSDSFSGMNVLQKIKSFNQGNQVIIFTASNKVWNLKALLDAGADGYYMKESPEFGFSAEFFEQNYLQFQEDVKRRFERDFLKNIYISYQKMLQKINDLSCANDFKAEIKQQFQIFWDMILVAKTKFHFANAYVTLYSIIELINDYFVQQMSVQNKM